MSGRVTIEDLRAAAEWVRCNEGDAIGHVADWLEAEAGRREARARERALVSEVAERCPGVPRSHIRRRLAECGGVAKETP